MVFVEPQFTGNVGFLARTMANFDFDKMILVNPPELDDDAYRFSKHARSIVENAMVMNSFREVREFLDFMVGTSGISTKSAKKFNRIALSPEELGKRIWNFEGKVGIVFGRENYGLYNEELELCDVLVTVPTSPNYPIMNVTHAAAIVLYEIYRNSLEVDSNPRAEDMELDILVKRFSEILSIIDFPSHKKKNTEVMFRRLLGRAILSKWEFHSLMGVMKRVKYHLKGET